MTLKSPFAVFHCLICRTEMIDFEVICILTLASNVHSMPRAPADGTNLPRSSFKLQDTQNLRR
jgi:hypothetical protein